VEKEPGDEVYSGSAIKMGEAEALVHSTGMHTFFGRTASLVAQTIQVGHFQLVLKSIGYFCISFIIVWVIAELLVQFVGRHKPCTITGYDDRCPNLSNVVVLIVGGIPVAMPTVLSVTMAIGASQLAKRQAIVRRLTAVEVLSLICQLHNSQLSCRNWPPWTYFAVIKRERLL
jgi:H+-transporting ATPase